MHSLTSLEFVIFVVALFDLQDCTVTFTVIYESPRNGRYRYIIVRKVGSGFHTRSGGVTMLTFNDDISHI
jgi:hypothetical protein